MSLLHFPRAWVILFYLVKVIELQNWKTELWHKQNPWERSGQFEGDIRLKKRRGVDPLLYWPRRELPYEISSDFNTRQKDVILRSLKYVSNKTCIKMRPRRESHNRSVYFTKAPGYGCSSYLGYQGVLRQPIHLDPRMGCVKFATVVHQILHTLGMGHQHTIPNRDEYLVINWSNVIRGKEYNFAKHNHRSASGFKYDYDSIMHYDSYAFSVNGMRTIEAVVAVAELPMGQTVHCPGAQTLWGPTGPVKFSSFNLVF